MKSAIGVPITALAFAVGACGSDRDKPATTTQAPTQSVATPQPEKPKPMPYVGRVTACIEGVVLKVTPQQGVKGYLVSSPSGRKVADLNTFATEKQSRAFYAQLVVEAVGGGKGVATFYPETKDAEKRVIGDCLTP